MLKNPFQVAVAFAVVALIVKLTIFSLNLQHGDMENYIRYIYMLILLVAVFFGIRSNMLMAEQKTTFLEDLKAGARTASFFAIIVAGITYIYYAKIDADFFRIKQIPLIEELNKSTKEIIQEGTESKDVIIANYSNQLSSIKVFLSPYFQAMWTMFGLVFMGLFNSFVFALLLKKIPGFKA